MQNSKRRILLKPSSITLMPLSWTPATMCSFPTEPWPTTQCRTTKSLFVIPTRLSNWTVHGGKDITRRFSVWSRWNVSKRLKSLPLIVFANSLTKTVSRVWRSRYCPTGNASVHIWLSRLSQACAAPCHLQNGPSNRAMRFALQIVLSHTKSLFPVIQKWSNRGSHQSVHHVSHTCLASGMLLAVFA